VTFAARYGQVFRPGGVRILADKNNRRYLTKQEEAVLRVDIAHGYFIYGKDKDAIKQAEKALQLAGADIVPRAYWVAGIASWRSGTYGTGIGLYAYAG
jgi:hypothetical protein